MSISDYIFTDSYNDDYSYGLSRSMSKYDYAKSIERDFGSGGYKPTLARKNERLYRKNDVFMNPTKYSDAKIKYIKNRNIYNINFYGRDGVIDSEIYYDLYKNRPRLNIRAHGTVNKELFGDEGSRIIIGQEYLNGGELAKFAQRLREDSDFDSVRLLSCFSAAGGDDSLISKVSAKLRVPVKGYEGEVIAYDYGSDQTFVNKLGTEEAKRRIVAEQAVGRGELVNEVVKGSGRYMRPGNTMMAGLEFF